MSGIVYRCVICAGLVPLDDAECANQDAGRCICLPCFARETGHDRARTDRRLREDIDREDDGLRGQRLGPETAAEWGEPDVSAYGQPLPDEDV